MVFHLLIPAGPPTFFRHRYSGIMGWRTFVVQAQCPQPGWRLFIGERGMVNERNERVCDRCTLISVIYNRAALLQLHANPNPQTRIHTQTITYMKNIITHWTSEANMMEFIILPFWGKSTLGMKMSHTHNAHFLSPSLSFTCTHKETKSRNVSHGL